MKKYILFAALVTVVVFFLSCAKGTDGAAGPSAANTAVKYFQIGAYPEAAFLSVTDSCLTSDFPSYDWGGCGLAAVGHNTVNVYGACRMTLKFSGIENYIPAGAKVTKAELQLTTSSVRGTSDIRCYSLTQDWIQGTACSAAGVDCATWVSRTAATWTSQGGDFNSTSVSNAKTITTTGQYKWTINTSTVQSWIDSPATNYGIIVKASNETTGSNDVFFVTTESGGFESPRLAVYYSLP